MLKYNKDFNLYMLWKLRTVGAKSRNILATKTALNFSGPHSKKLTNHSMCSNWHISENINMCVPLICTAGLHQDLDTCLHSTPASCLYQYIPESLFSNLLPQIQYVKGECICTGWGFHKPSISLFTFQTNK